MKFLDKKLLLTLASVGCAIGSAIVGIAQKKDDVNKMADKAAEIVMDKMSKQK